MTVNIDRNATVTLSEKIQQYRTTNELSRQIMANEMGISLHQIRAIEEGRTLPDTETMNRLIMYTSIPYETWVNPDEPLPQMVNNSPRKQRERLRRVIDEKADGNLSEFARLVEIDKSSLSRLLSGERRLNSEHFRQVEARTRTRYEWLKSGREPVYHPADWKGEEVPDNIKEGTMLATFLDRHGISWVMLGKQIGVSKAAATQYQHTQHFQAPKRAKILGGLRELTGDEGLTDGDVFSLSPSPQAPAVANIPRSVDVLDETKGIRLLRLPIRARAGFGYAAYLIASPSEQEFMSVSEDKLYPGVKSELHVIVEVNGDSMEPQLQSGFEMMAYKLPTGQFPKLDKIVMVDFRDELIIKRLVAIDWVDLTVTLRSDKGGAEMRIPMRDIRAVYHVYDYYKARL